VSVITSQAAGRLRLFSQPDFRRLWLVGLVVFGVRWLEMLAGGVFVYQRTGSPFAVALMMMRMLPMGFFGAGGIGVLASMDGVGAFCGALLMMFYARPRFYGRLYVGGTIGYLLMLIAFALSPTPLLAGLALLFTGLTSHRTDQRRLQHHAGDRVSRGAAGNAQSRLWRAVGVHRRRVVGLCACRPARRTRRRRLGYGRHWCRRPAGLGTDRALVARRWRRGNPAGAGQSRYMVPRA
jgi:hypothetical protein